MSCYTMQIQSFEEKIVEQEKLREQLKAKGYIADDSTLKEIDAEIERLKTEKADLKQQEDDFHGKLDALARLAHEEEHKKQRPNNNPFRMR